MSEAYLVDTNVLVRFFTGSPPVLAERARALLAEADAGKLSLEIPALVIAETICTLESFYGLAKDDVCEKLMILLRSRGIIAHQPEVVLGALQRYRTLPVHFVDAYLASTAATEKLPVFSFDHDFARFKDVDWKH